VRQHGREHAIEEHAEVGDVDLAVDVGPVLPRGFAVVDRAVVAGVVDAIRRIGREQRRALAAHQPREVVRGCGVAAHQAVAAEQPNVTALRGRDLGRLDGAWVLHRTRLLQ